MKYIEKDDEPKEFLEWKEKNSDSRWEDFRDPQKTIVRNSLLAEQGYICCYCGKRIHEDHITVIEHLKPKDKDYYPEDMFNYNNLLASCNGSSKDTIHITDGNITLKEIANTHGVREEKIKELNN